MTNMKKRGIAVLTAAILAAALTIPATATAATAEFIQVSSCKGSTLEVGERSGLIIGPRGTEYTVISGDPDTVAVEQVLAFWAAIAKAEGSAEITASNSTGEYGTVTLTVGPAADSAPSVEDDNTSLTDNMEIRQEIIRLINQTRKANGVSGLPVSEALMNAAQACSNRRCTWHHSPEESKAVVDAGCPYGFGDNLTVFTGTADAAQHAVDNWIKSPGCFQTMIDPRCDCIGVGVTQHDGIICCYMFVGIPNSANFYAQPNSSQGEPSRKLDGLPSW